MRANLKNRLERLTSLRSANRHVGLNPASRRVRIGLFVILATGLSGAAIANENPQSRSLGYGIGLLIGAILWFFPEVTRILRRCGTHLRRRTWQYSVRTLLLVVFATAVLLTVWQLIAPYHYQLQLIAAVEQLDGEVLPDPWAPAWMRSAMGDAFTKRIMPKATYVSFVRKPLTDVDLAWLATHRGVSEVRSLRLDETNISNAGLSVVHAFPKLWMLTINQCNVSDEGLKQLQGSRSLKHIDAIGTSISFVGIKEFEEMTPQCKVFTNANDHLRGDVPQ